MIELEQDTDLSNLTGEHDVFAHLVAPEGGDVTRGYLLGDEITALCGKTWVPSKDPTRYPICPTCKERRPGA